VEVPASVVVTKWARCALLVGDAHTTLPTYAWHWDPLRRFVSPPGIGVLRTTDGYAHGGVSPQECMVPEMVVQKPAPVETAAIERIDWRRLRCRVAVRGAIVGLRVDIRRQWKDASSSIVAEGKTPDLAGTVSLVVEDDSLEGTGAVVVLLAGEQVIARRATTVGEEA